MAARPTDIVSETVPIAPVSDEVWKMILDRKRTPDTLIHTFKGEVWQEFMIKDEETGTFIKDGKWVPKGEAIMNDIGIRFFSNILYSIMSPDKIITFFTDGEVKDRASSMTAAIIKLIAERGREFEIKPANRDIVVRLMDDYYFANLTASRGGVLLKALKPMLERKEIYTPKNRQSNIPFLS